MRKIVDYKIAWTPSDDSHRLQTEVLYQMSFGWQPIGGISIDKLRLLQAMVKYEDSPSGWLLGTCDKCGEKFKKDIEQTSDELTDEVVRKKFSEKLNKDLLSYMRNNIKE